MNGVRALLVEIGGSHDEVLLSWYRDLRRLGATVFVACDQVLWDRLALPDAAGWVEAAAVGTLAHRLRAILRIRRYVQRNKITHVVLNTATGTTLRDLAVILPSRCTVIGVCHDSGKLVRGSNQRMVTRNVDAYTFLAPYLFDIVPEAFDKPIAIVTATARDASLASRAHPSDGRLNVVIAGGINWYRRDYDSLFTESGFARMGENVRFVLGGGVDPENAERLAQMVALAPPGTIEVYGGYIPHDVYAGMIYEADIVLPLTHPSCRDYHFYVRSRITGSMSSAWAYAKPLMLERGFEKHASLASSIFYDVDALPDMLRRFSEDRTLLAPFAVTPEFAKDEVRLRTIRTLFGDNLRAADYHAINE